MVIESLVNPFRAEEHPKRMFFIGFLYSTIAIFLSYWIFPEQSSMVLVFLTTMAALPLIYNTIKMEEKKDTEGIPEKNLLKEHGRALSFFMYLFLGITISCAVWFTILPATLLNELFRTQLKTLQSLSPGTMTGFSASSLNSFIDILFNNVKVLIFCILFSFLYGVGSLFILTWNATVIGAAIGITIRKEIYTISTALGVSSVAAYTKIISYGLFKYAIHGIPEILSYFVAGFADGIISIAVIRHDFGTSNYERILMDSSVLLFLSLSLVVFAAFLEVYVTPYIIGGIFG